MTSLNQEFLDKKDKKSNVYLNVAYAQLRVDIFKTLNELSYDSEKRVSLITEDILEIVDKFIKNKQNKCFKLIHGMDGNICTWNV